MRVLNMKYNFFLLVLTVLGLIFMDPDQDFFGSDPDQEKKSDPGYKTLVLVHTIIVLVVYNIHIVVVVVYSREGQEGGRVPSASHVGAEKNTNKI